MTILHIFGAAFRADSASARAFLLIKEIIDKKNEEIKDHFAKENPLRQKMISVLHHGSLSLDKLIKRLSYRILEGLMKKGVYLAELRDIVIRMLANCIEVGEE